MKILCAIASSLSAISAIVNYFTNNIEEAIFWLLFAIVNILAGKGD